MPKFLILSVDDDSFTQGLIKEILSNEYEISLVPSGEACLLYLEDHTPDLILLDVSMPPGINGFETCRGLKKNEKLLNVPVIFVSGQSSEAERLEGYESGGVDYILKPFEIEYLRDTINLNLELARQNSKKNKLEQSLSDSNQSAIHALNYSNDLILVIQFYEHCHKFDTQEIIARQLLSITTSLGLRTVIQIRMNGTSKEFSDYGVVTPLEREVIYENHELGMFYKLHSYLMVNHSNISILIKNMPVETDAEHELTYSKLQETLRALNYAANRCVTKLIKKSNLHANFGSIKNNDLIDIMILKLQNIFDDYKENTIKSLKEIIDSLDLLKQESYSETVKAQIGAIIKTALSETSELQNQQLEFQIIKEEIEDLLEIIA